MKRLLSIFVIIGLSANCASAQAIHAAAPGTKGNTIELTVVNGSTGVSYENVHVRLLRHSANLAFKSNEQSIRDIPPGQNAAATLTFDVARSVPVNTQDTLQFTITDKTGSVWMKSVIVRYTGPTVFALDQNFPNPFNPSTTIQYQLPADSRVSLKVYDMLGREVATIVNEERPAGYHEVRWIASNAASGVYFYRLEAQPLNGGNRFQSVKRLMVLK